MFCFLKSGLFAKDLIVRGHQEALLSPFVPRLYLEQSLVSHGLNLLANELITHVKSWATPDQALLLCELGVRLRRVICEREH